MIAFLAASLAGVGIKAPALVGLYLYSSMVIDSNSFNLASDPFSREETL